MMSDVAGSQMTLVRDMPRHGWSRRDAETNGSLTLDRNQTGCDHRFRRADAAMLFLLPRRGLARELLEPGDLLWRTVRPSFECLPVLGWDGDDPPFEDVRLGGIERFTSNEIAEA